MVVTQAEQAAEVTLGKMKQLPACGQAQRREDQSSASLARVALA